MNTAQKNILFGVAHETVWGISFALIDPITTLQLALNDLGGRAELAGLLGGLLFALVNAPQMLSAFLFAPKWSDPRNLSLLHLPALACTAMLAALFFFFPEMSTASKLRLYLLISAGFFVLIGLVVPHWISLISRCVPEGIRGRYFAWCFSLANLGGIFSGALAAHWISRGGLAWGYGASFGLAFLLQLVSISLLWFLEPLQERPNAPGKLAPFLSQQWKLIQHNRGFAAFAAIFILMQFCGAPYSLFTDYLKGRGLDTSWWALFNATKNLGGVLGSFIIGHLADRKGPRSGLYWAYLSMALALLLMPLTTHPAWSSVAFFGGGFFNSAFPVVNLYLFMHLAEPGETSSFSGTFSTVTAPMVFIAPLIVGQVASRLGYNSAFALSLAACAAAALLLWRSKNFGERSLERPA
jgi:predicted MFS family arabinose efflux permease